MLAAEFILFATVLVLALVVGLGYLSQVINQQIIDQANAMAASDEDEDDTPGNGPPNDTPGNGPPDDTPGNGPPDFLTADEVFGN